ncbi:MAG: DnaJ domain-containing protein [Gammaproteobacteria bacterium]|nr:DnaJ domain-containing protein [Gammaproteobacteria bacterium]
MLLKLLAAAAFLFLILFALRWFSRGSPQDIRRLLRRLPFYLGAGLFILLAVRGHLHWLFAAIGAALAFLPRLASLLQYVPLLRRLYQRYRTGPAAGAGSQAGGASQVEGRYVRMQLDHASGEIDGMVLAGAFKGRRLSELSLAQAIGLWRECRTRDEDSARLVEAYLDREHAADWRAQAGAEEPSDTSAPSPGGSMTRGEAYEVLGLESGASDQDIIAAHRRLMQKFHPDRGGSDYLAARINQAKDVLLGK